MAELEKCIITKFSFFFLFIVTMKGEHKHTRKHTHTHAQQTNVYENSIYMKINKMAAVWEGQGGQHCPCVWNNNNKFD